MVATRLLYSWAMSFIVQFAPLNEPSDYPEARETPEARKARYESIVEDTIRVAFDPSKQPLFRGPAGRIRYVILLESNMSFESGFRRDVDYGLGPKARGCFGTCVCLMQINVGAGSVRINDHLFTADELLGNRLACLQAGDALLRYSWRKCSSLAPEERLAAYISGNCQDRTKESAYRWYRAVGWLRNNPPPVADSDVMEELHPRIAVN